MDYRIEIMVNGKIRESILIEKAQNPEQAIRKALNIDKYISARSFNIYIMNSDGKYWIYTLRSNGIEIRVPYRKSYNFIIPSDDLEMYMNGNKPLPK